MSGIMEMQESAESLPVSFDQALAEFQLRLVHQDHLDGDPIDQLAEIFGLFLEGRGVLAKQNTEWQIALTTRLERDRVLAAELVEQLRPVNEAGDAREYVDPRYYWKNKIHHEVARVREPKMQPQTSTPQPKRKTGIDSR
jgi:hypothetical protein